MFRSKAADSAAQHPLAADGGQSDPVPPRLKRHVSHSGRTINLVDQGNQIREVYAQFGLAVYLAQVLEHGLVNAMVVGWLAKRERVTRTEIDAFMDSEFEKPLGRLIAALGNYMHVPDTLSSKLREVLERTELASSSLLSSARRRIHERNRKSHHAR